MIVCRDDDPRRADVGTGVANSEILRFDGATVAANGTDSQSGYWSRGHFVRNIATVRPVFGNVRFTGAHRSSVIDVGDGLADLAAIDVHSWQLALDYEREVTDRLAVIGTTAPTPGVVCVVAWELAHHRKVLNEAIAEAVESIVGTPLGRRLHIGGYRVRRLDDFQVVADRVEAATHQPWHR